MANPTHLHVSINGVPWTLNTAIIAPTGEDPRSCAHAIVCMVGAMWDPLYADSIRATFQHRGKDAISWIHAYGIREEV